MTDSNPTGGAANGPSSKSSDRIRSEWQDQYKRGYAGLMESERELGRHGVIAEIISRKQAGGTVLDAGCGTGILSRLLDLRKFRYLGVDIAENALAFARAQDTRGDATFVSADLRSMDFQQKFDTVVLNETAYLVEPGDLDQIISRNCRQGSLLVYSVFQFANTIDVIRCLRRHGASGRTILLKNMDDNIIWHIGWFSVS
jgi:2-polyprenyl-3-methyl-5-hydroxy-6-metoxy-1,4-benzoquinol methylase